MLINYDYMRHFCILSKNKLLIYHNRTIIAIESELSDKYKLRIIQPVWVISIFQQGDKVL